MSEVLLMKYGHGMLLVDDHVGQFNVKEVRGSVLKKMLDEQNGVSKDTMKTISEVFSPCWILTRFIK